MHWLRLEGIAENWLLVEEFLFEHTVEIQVVSASDCLKRLVHSACPPGRHTGCTASALLQMGHLMLVEISRDLVKVHVVGNHVQAHYTQDTEGPPALVAPHSLAVGILGAGAACKV